MTDYPFCPVHGIDWEQDPDNPQEFYCPVCRYADRPLAACCCSAGVSGRMCGRPATILARRPQWRKSVSAFCDRHPPDAVWIIETTNPAGFVVDSLQEVGTPAYYGITLQEQKE